MSTNVDINLLDIKLQKSRMGVKCSVPSGAVHSTVGTELELWVPLLP